MLSEPNRSLHTDRKNSYLTVKSDKINGKRKIREKRALISHKEDGVYTKGPANVLHSHSHRKTELQSFLENPLNVCLAQMIL